MDIHELLYFFQETSRKVKLPHCLHCTTTYAMFCVMRWWQVENMELAGLYSWALESARHLFDKMHSYILSRFFSPVADGLSFVSHIGSCVVFFLFSCVCCIFPRSMLAVVSWLKTPCKNIIFKVLVYPVGGYHPKGLRLGFSSEIVSCGLTLKEQIIFLLLIRGCCISV